MTISYTSEVPNGSSFGCFWKILWKWRGSVYKLVWRELVAYLTLYFIINLVYRYALTNDQRELFDKIRLYSTKQLESIPMSFVLGFYVSLVVKRWWEQYRLLPWPDTLALFISAAIPNNAGNGETGRLMRRNIMRYMVLAYVITLQRISLRVKRRFPTVQHLVDAGLMMESERKIFETLNARSPMSKYWMPLVWATNIINRARKENLITSDHIVQTILMELSDIRRRLGGLIGYDTVCVPLVYTQVVTLVLYTYFIAALMGRQMVPSSDKDGGDLYFPIFTVLQFVFYVGWLKVAEVLINPFGEDDDDIELNWLIDRHIKAAYMIVDEMHEEHPELLKDQYWEEVVPKDLPYTVASEHYRRFEPKGSAENFKVKASDALYANLMTAKRSGLPEDVYADYESVDTPMVERRKNWIQRQFSRMGSIRSQSTAYSSGGVFNRNRINSVYSSPETGLPLSNTGNNNNNNGNNGGNGGGIGGVNTQPIQKMSLYEKFVNRKSIRAQRLSNKNNKLNINGSVLTTAPKTNRPRIPTPDVTKESVEKENRLSLNMQSGVLQNPTSVASGVALMASQLANTPAMYQHNIGSDVPVVGTLLLSPIKEMDSNSAHNTLQAGHPTTTALAQAVLPAALKNVSLDSTTMSGTTSNISTFTFPFATIPQITATQVTQSDIGKITAIPVSVSLSRTSPSPSLHNLNSDNIDGLLTASAKINLSRQNSLNVNPIIDDSYILERKHSERIKSTKSMDETDILNKNNSSLNLNKTMENSLSAPSTLTKRKPEQKTGEVYV